jgi:hypothetical protein
MIFVSSFKFCFLLDLLSAPINFGDITAIIDAKKLFRSCSNTETIEKYGESKVLKFLNDQFGGWPILNDRHFNPSVESTFNNLIDLYKIDVNPLFNMYVSTNPSNPNETILWVSDTTLCAILIKFIFFILFFCLS